jgi:hypothetical protein
MYSERRDAQKRRTQMKTRIIKMEHDKRIL